MPRTGSGYNLRARAWIFALVVAGLILLGIVSQHS
jgi:hypothetical protein